MSFDVGEKVRVRVQFPLGHVRTPRYIRGKSGVVERVVGQFDNPEELAYGRPGDKRTLYRVRFAQGEVFPERTASTDAHGGASVDVAQDGRKSTDTIDVEIYEHWLEKA